MVSSNGQFSHVGLYVHIPFCRSKCSYCDFNSFSGLEHLAPAYVEAVQREVTGWAELNKRRWLPSFGEGSGKLGVRTIYFGGGTPTVLSVDAIAAILSSCQAAFLVDRDAEVTVEANPGTLDEERLRGLLAAGVNRLSIGAQSFNPRLLRLLGRSHTSLATVEACKAAYRAGFDNVSLDLIYGIPTQSAPEWQDDLSKATELRPTHLSLYGLSVEEGTPLSTAISRGRLESPDPDLAADMYTWADEMLSGVGYDHYEISNWAIPGARCEHNLTYWRNLPYIGLGAGAHSSFCSVRLANTSDPAEYIARMEAASEAEIGNNQVTGGFALAVQRLGAVEQVLELDRTTEIAETAILNLRLSDGLSEEQFRRRFGTSIDTVYGQQIDQLRDIGLVDKQVQGIALTTRGRLLGNEVFIRLLPGGVG